MNFIARFRGFTPLFFLPVLAAGTGGLWGCRKAPGADDPVARLADMLRAENVVKSPLAGLEAARLTPSLYPVESYPVVDAVENPWGLIRKHRAGNMKSRILFAPPASEFGFEVTLPRDPVLSFAVGIVRDMNSAAAMSAGDGNGGGVEFIVRLETDGRRKVVFQKHLALPPARESRTLNYSAERLDLPAGGRKVRLRFITAGTEGAFALWYSPVVHGRGGGGGRPNVVLVSLDTLRADHVGAYGYGRETTPNLDALAAESAVFQNVFAPSSWTLPSHVSMLTGLECQRHGVYYEDDRMDPAQPTLAALLKERGYTCGAVTGGAFVDPSYGFFMGFDGYSIGHGEFADPRLAAHAAEEAERWLEANADKPFFLFLHTYQIHYPYRSPEEYARMFAGPNPARLAWDFQDDHGGWPNVFRPLPEAERRNIVDLYDGEIRFTDEALTGPLIEKLRALGIYDRTLLIVTSDHGEEFFEHGGWVHTWSLYNASLKVPLVVKFPRGKFASRKVADAVRLTDIVPTVLDVLGIAPPEEAFDGRSLVPLLTGREKGDRSVRAEIAAEVGHNLGAWRSAAGSGRDLLILNGPFKPENLARFAFPPPAFPPLELYDLAADPGQKDNVKDDPAKTSAVRALAETAQSSALAGKSKAGRKLSPEMEARLRALGYIK